ncbi:hypothetical protein [Archangium lipolyticum]|uniref:hypothetical protein n=1 Tax=Archangium lipolyticum TaxID=2970465 RepID=UPI002149CA2B|nr:hypothetical protein [Archangium lipolyticum]
MEYLPAVAAPRVGLRVRRTRLMLREALLALLREKDVDTLSVQSGGFDSRRFHPPLGNVTFPVSQQAAP